MNKRGQFFLIAALVIIGIMIGLVAVYTTAQTPTKETMVYDLSNEINFESGQVIDSGVFNDLPENLWHNRVENLTDHYASSNLGTDFITIYGNRSEMYVLSYISDSSGSVGITSGNTPIGSSIIHQRRQNASFNPNSEDEITVLIDQEIEYTFDIKPGQTFFVILKKEFQGERYVSASEPDIN